MAEAYNNTVTTLPEITEDFFAFLVVPPVTYFRNLQTKARGVLREDSFLRVTSTQEEAESVRTYLKDNYGVDTQVVPLSVNFTGDSNVTLSLKRLVDVEAIDREPDVGDLIQYTGNRIIINGVDSPRYTFGRIDTQYVEEHPSHLYYTNSRVSSHIAATSLDTLTPDEGDNSTKIATTQYTDRAIASLIDSAPSTLDTLNELAAAINDDADFHTTVLNANAALQTELDTTQAGAGLTGTGLYEEDSNTRYLQSAESLKNADSILDSEIFAIQNELDATQTGAGLDTDGSYIAKTDANYINQAVSLQDADEKLAAQTKVNEDAIAAETIARQNADSALQDELDNTQSGAGLSVSGEYSANSSSYYLKTAASLKDADNKLDIEIKGLEDNKIELTDLDVITGSASGSGSLSYDDTSGEFTFNPPNLSSYLTSQIQSDFNETDSNSAAFIKNIPDPYTLPTATSSSLGGIKIGYTETGKNYPVELASGKAYVNVPWEDTVYTLPVATYGSLGGVKLGSDTQQSTGPQPTTSTAGRTYAVQRDSSQRLMVNVPWVASSGGSSYTLPTAADGTLGGIQIGYEQNDKNYPVELDNGKAYVNVPWEDDDTVYTLPEADHNILGGIKIHFDSTSSILYISDSEDIPT